MIRVVVSVGYYLCELLNAANVTAQFFFTNLFLGGNFSRIALDGLALDEYDSVLPILAECWMET